MARLVRLVPKRTLDSGPSATPPTSIKRVQEVGLPTPLLKPGLQLPGRACDIMTLEGDSGGVCPVFSRPNLSWVLWNPKASQAAWMLSWQ